MCKIMKFVVGFVNLLARASLVRSESMVVPTSIVMAAKNPRTHSTWASEHSTHSENHVENHQFFHIDLRQKHENYGNLTRSFDWKDLWDCVVCRLVGKATSTADKSPP